MFYWCAIEKPTKNGFLKRVKEIIFFSLHIRKARGRSCRNPNWILKRTILAYRTPGVCYFCFLGGVLITMGQFFVLPKNTYFIKRLIFPQKNCLFTRKCYSLKRVYFLKILTIDFFSRTRGPLLNPKPL